jgi:ribose 5-phosphate isomerase A
MSRIWCRGVRGAGAGGFMSHAEQDRAKKSAGYYAADMVEDGSVIGLGTGSTVFYAMERLSERIQDGLRIAGVATSYQAEMRARACGIPLRTLDDCFHLDCAIDGADQIDPALYLIKGRGAAQTRERCVAEASRRLIIVADAGKLTRKLTAPVPVEVIPFAAALVAERLKALGCTPLIREGIKKDGPVITDNGNWIIDCEFGAIEDPVLLQTTINNLPGVLSCGIFTEFTEKTIVVVGEKEGARLLSD